MISVDQLTAPLAGEDPCGEDLSSGTSLIELEALVRGKEETQFSAAEEPDWRAAKALCLELFNRSRDLRVAVALSLTLMKTEALAGFRDGLAVIRGLLESQWEKVHPKLDPEDANDPLQRMNTLAVISAPVAMVGDSMRFIERLRTIPLTNSRQIGRMTIGLILDSRRSEGVQEGVERVDASQIEAAFRDTPAEEREVTFTVLEAALENLRGIEAALKVVVSTQQSPNFSDLKKILTDAKTAVQPYVKSAASAAPDADTAGGQVASGGGEKSEKLSGRVTTRDDVLRALQQVRSYYSEHEPASPIPLLIRRIERMVPMSFLQLMTELAPDSINQVTNIVGPQE